MRFCPVCRNAYSLIANENNLVLNCKKCGNEEPMKPSNMKEALISESIFKNNRTADDTLTMINEFTREDPTIPNVKGLRCPNVQCDSQTDLSIRQAIYVKTDVKALKYQYECTVCRTQWST